MSKLRILLEQFRCDHSRICIAAYIFLLAAMLSASSGFAGYYINDVQNDILTTRLEAAYNQVVAEKNERIAIYAQLVTALQNASDTAYDAAGRSDSAASKSLAAANANRPQPKPLPTPTPNKPPAPALAPAPIDNRPYVLRQNGLVGGK